MGFTVVWSWVFRVIVPGNRDLVFSIEPMKVVKTNRGEIFFVGINFLWFLC